MSLCLDRQELEALTGRKQPKRMAVWLAERGWKFEPGADGLPKVDREYYRQRMGVQDDKKRRPRLTGLAHGAT